MMFDELIRRTNLSHTSLPPNIQPAIEPAIYKFTNPGPGDSVFIPPGSFMFNAGSDAKYGDPETLAKLYEKLVIVYRCVNMRGENVAMLPYQVIIADKKGNEIDIKDAPEFLIFKQPNQFQTRFDFFHESIIRLDTQGECFWNIDRASNGKVAAIYADWRSSEIEVKGSVDYLYSSFIRTMNGTKREYPVEDVFFLKYINPFNPLRGLSPLSASRDNLILQLNTFTFLKRFFQNGLGLGGVLSTKGNLDKDNLERLKAQITNEYGGVENMHKFLLTWAGLEFTPLARATISDSDTIDLLNLNKEDIAMLYGVPLELLTSGRNTYENVSAANTMFWSKTLKPLLEKMAQQINLDLIPQLTNRPDIRFKFDLSQVEALQQDRETVSRLYSTAYNMNASTPNEYRINVLKLQPFETPESNMTRYELERKRLEDIGTLSSIPGKVLKSSQWFQNKYSSDDLTRIWREKIFKIDPFEAQISSMMKGFFRRQESETIANLEALGDDLENNNVVLDFQGVFIKNSSNKAEPKLSLIFDMEKWVNELKELGEPVITEIVLLAGQEWLEPGAILDLTHPRVLYALGERVRLFSTLPNGTTADFIQRELREGFLNRESIQQMANRIRRVFDKAEQYRADRIARTEAVGATNFGTQTGLVQGQWQYKMWITSRDLRVRDGHQIDGMVVHVNDVFWLAGPQAGETRMFPDDLNERCIIIGVQTAAG